MGRFLEHAVGLGSRLVALGVAMSIAASCSGDGDDGCAQGCTTTEEQCVTRSWEMNMTCTRVCLDVALACIPDCNFDEQCKAGCETTHKSCQANCNTAQRADEEACGDTARSCVDGCS